MTEELCGSTETTTGKPCRNGPSCPYHGSGLSSRKVRARDLLAAGEHRRKDVAKLCGVTARTLRNWLNKHPELAEAAEQGDWTQYEEIRDAWFERLKEGDHSASEIIFYLKNKSRLLDGEDWRDTKEIEHSGGVEHEHEVSYDRVSQALAVLAGEPAPAANGAPENGGRPVELGEGHPRRFDTS